MYKKEDPHTYPHVQIEYHDGVFYEKLFRTLEKHETFSPKDEMIGLSNFLNYNEFVNLREREITIKFFQKENYTIHVSENVLSFCPNGTIKIHRVDDYMIRTYE